MIGETWSIIQSGAALGVSRLLDSDGLSVTAKIGVRFPAIDDERSHVTPAASLPLDIDCMNSGDPLPSPHRNPNGQPPSLISNMPPE